MTLEEDQEEEGSERCEGKDGNVRSLNKENDYGLMTFDANFGLTDSFLSRSWSTRCQEQNRPVSWRCFYSETSTPNGNTSFALTSGSASRSWMLLSPITLSFVILQFPAWHSMSCLALYARDERRTPQ